MNKKDGSQIALNNVRDILKLDSLENIYDLIGVGYHILIFEYEVSEMVGIGMWQMWHLSDSNAKIGHLQSDELIGYLGQHFEIHIENVRRCWFCYVCSESA